MNLSDFLKLNKNILCLGQGISLGNLMFLLSLDLQPTSGIRAGIRLAGAGSS